MKKLPAPGILLLSVFFGLKGFGQFTTVPTKISTPYGKVTVPMQQYTPWMRFTNYSGSSNKKHKFYIVLLNDSIIETRAKINIDDSIHYLEWGKKDQRTVIKPVATKQIYREGYENRIFGIPHDSCWLFLVNIGNIRTYSVTSDIDYPLIGYIQKGEDGKGPILPLTKDNLLTMVADNEKAVKLVKKEKLIAAITLYNKE
ncbi:MAG TPA: hypothetical protein VJU78_12225 [Chitinophagaceae bacterium]|nr:hypothetical protein [Chitinophagaceae bacterium]